MQRSLEGSDTSLRIPVRCLDATLEDHEAVALDGWVAAHPFDGIDRITVAARAVSVHASHPDKNGSAAAIAVRHPGRLTDALDEAIARLRNAP
jgi:hypothetical protein